MGSKPSKLLPRQWYVIKMQEIYKIPKNKDNDIWYDLPEVTNFHIEKEHNIFEDSEVAIINKKYVFHELDISLKDLVIYFDYDYYYIIQLTESQNDIMLKMAKESNINLEYKEDRNTCDCRCK